MAVPSGMAVFSVNSSFLKPFVVLLLVPLMPLAVTVTSHGSSVLTVQWKAPAGQRDSYMVSVSEEDSTAIRSHMAVEKASTNLTIEGLTPGICYLVAVWSLAGPYSSTSRNSTACTGESGGQSSWKRGCYISDGGRSVRNN